jgi:hypothetical protein
MQHQYNGISQTENTTTYTFTDGRFVDLDGMNSGFLKINNLITESECELLGLDFT